MFVSVFEVCGSACVVCIVIIELSSLRRGVLVNGMRLGNNQNGSTNNNIKQYQQQSQKGKKANEGITYSWEQYINHPKGPQNLQQIRSHHPPPHPQQCGLRCSRLYPRKNTQGSFVSLFFVPAVLPDVNDSIAVGH